MSPPEKKRKKNSTSTKKPSLIYSPTSQLTSLPDDLVLDIFARVSRLYYSTLSLVSMRFRSLLALPELYKTRSLIGRTENCLYVCLRSDCDTNTRWFTLCRKPDQILNNEIIEHKKKKKEKKKKKQQKPSRYVLTAISVGHHRPAHRSGLVAVGSNVYNTGGPMDEADSSSVSILDCKSHTWHEAPSMRVERRYPVANVLDGKIYVRGRYNDFNYSNWMEVFDPETQTWESLDKLNAWICGFNILKRAGLEGEIFREMNRWLLYPNCVIEDILYNYNLIEENFQWYDTKVRVWRKVMGLNRKPRFPQCIETMVDYGGKMAIFWDKIVTSNGKKKKIIRCAVVALERHNSKEILGKVQWHDAVLSVPMSCRLYHVLAPFV